MRFEELVMLRTYLHAMVCLLLLNSCSQLNSSLPRSARVMSVSFNLSVFNTGSMAAKTQVNSILTSMKSVQYL